MLVGQKLYSRKSCSIRGKVVVFGQKLLYLCKCGCILAKVVEFGQNSSIRADWLYLGKVVLIGRKWLQ